LDKFKILKEYIEANYNLDSISNIDLLADYGNSVFLIRNGFQQYIFRIYDIERSIEVIKSESEILSYLTNHNLNVESLISNCKGLYYDTIELNNSIRNCAMYKLLNGTIYDEMLTKEQSMKLGLLTGKLHNILDLYQGNNSFRRFDYEELVWKPWQRIKPYVAHNKELNQFYETVIMESEAILKNNERLLSWGICHGDLHAGNVMFSQDNEPSLFDFELCCNSWRLYDLATFIWSVLPREEYSEGTLELVDTSIKSFIKGYTTQKALCSAELEVLFNIVLLRHIWRQAERIEFEETVDEWRSEQHLIVQMNRMIKWIELYEINFKEKLRL
jgi:Ser/Thr protein kinase RdoA (MazF antagonist)